MPLDQTDKKLINGLIVATVVVGVVYFWPWDFPFTGYGKQSELLDSARDTLQKTGVKYVKNHPPMQPVNFGLQSTEVVKDEGDVSLISDLKHIYADANKVTQDYIQVKQASNKIAFPEWTQIPEAEMRSPGTYYAKTFDRHKVLVEIDCKKSGVELDDREIGFGKYTGIVHDLEKSKELLREMFIAEKVIDLCIQAKLTEEQRERNLNKKPEAFMRIMQVEPQVSEPTGPTALVPNPKYDPGEKTATSPKFRKYTIDRWANFIQEYPVKIQLICDTNSFITFLHSIRTIEGQFLVIRQLEILSPALDESNRDKSELEPFKQDLSLSATTAAPNGSTTLNTPKRWPSQKEQIIVTMTAAGMDFFDPKELPNGLYQKKAPDEKPGGRKGRTLGKVAPSVTPTN